jgi:hypothetical protein
MKNMTFILTKKDKIMTVNIFLWETNKDITARLKNAVNVPAAEMCREVPEVSKFLASCTYILV